MNTGTADRGYTLTELLLVMAIVAVLSAIAVPTFSDVRVRRLESAGSEVATALRFAREEAVRTGVPHGLRKIDGQNTVAVFRIDLGNDPRVEVYDVKHPIEAGRLYSIDLETNRKMRATTVAAHFQIFSQPAIREAISFNGRGEPIDGITGQPLATARGGIVLNNGDYGTSVSVWRLAGRVTIDGIGTTVGDPATVF